MHWLQQLAIQAGGEQAAEALFKGRGISLILKKFDVDYKVRNSEWTVPFSLKSSP